MADEFSVLYLTTGERGTTPDPGGDGHPSVVTEESFAALGERLASGQFDCVVAGIDVDPDSGAQTLRAACERFPKTPFVVLSGDGNGVVTEPVSGSAVEDGGPQITADGFTTLPSTAVRSDSAMTAGSFGVFAEHATDAVVTIDADGNISGLNPSATTLLDSQPEELVGAPLSVVFPPDGSPGPGVPPFDSDDTTPVQWRSTRLTARQPDGEEFPVAATFGTFERADERHYVGIVRPRQPESAAEADSWAPRTLDSFVALDDDYRVRTLSLEAADTLSLDADTAAGEQLWELVPETQPSRFRAHLERAFETKTPDRFEAYVDAFDAWLSVQVFPSNEGLTVHFQDVTAQRELARERDELETVVELDRLADDISDSLVTATGWAEIAQLVCDGLVESPLFSYAWFARGSTPTDVLDPAATAGDQTYADDITVTTDGSPTGQGPAGRAVESRTVTVENDILEAPSFEPWREQVLDTGFRSSAAVPIVFKDTLYGVICLYADRPNVFTDDIVEVLSGLGTVVGLALSSNERRAALIADQSVELKLRIQDPSIEFLDTTDDLGIALLVDGATAVDDHTFTYYFTAVGLDDFPAFKSAFEALDGVDDVAILDRDDDETLVTMTVSDPPISTLFAEHGGSISQLEFTEDGCLVVAELPRSVPIRSLVESCDALFERTELLAKREHKRPERRVSEYRSALEDRLTDRQREVIETAMNAGYFEWPRRNDAEDIADALGISSPTFHEHLRAAQEKLLTDLFAGEMKYAHDVE
ncbi:bacterio-opsin activator domain-containing protein [Haloarchaeobius sp. DFWS5]|uniref:bacterio-opsin activator domain-containing protein n=1 Tax=Haloarchaeobius sp. DFWS5 TaxID=3446114 RepID=UPI003EBF7419